MFDLFSWSHILIILIVALVVVGPKDLPKLMRTAGQWMGKARGMADQFRKSFDEMARASELDELRKEIDALRNQRPLGDLHDNIMKPLTALDVPREDGVETARVAEETKPDAALPAPQPESSEQKLP
ncbi:MAG TPA: Sec-independent protein translocase protein TatB [Rhizomicrobium sp.]|jgi:sec-independent protein translocase protein TatB|nr:Sec-independent protein translocase protein TatB [Rhizomicrobium sp.]HEX4532720.1 Sec-independent protein translocase protein TatB [Rhizomicrobium sp.]